MPHLNRTQIRGWLERRNWSIQRLTDELHAVDPDDLVPVDVVRNCVNGHDPMRPGRIRNIEKVTVKYAEPVSFEQLVAGGDEEEEGAKEETTGPPKRKNGSGTGPPATDRGAAA